MDLVALLPLLHLAPRQGDLHIKPLEPEEEEPTPTTTTATGTTSPNAGGTSKKSHKKKGGNRMHQKADLGKLSSVWEEHLHGPVGKTKVTTDGVNIIRAKDETYTFKQLEDLTLKAGMDSRDAKRFYLDEYGNLVEKPWTLEELALDCVGSQMDCSWLKLSHNGLTAEVFGPPVATTRGGGGGGGAGGSKLGTSSDDALLSARGGMPPPKGTGGSLGGDGKKNIAIFDRILAERFYQPLTNIVCIDLSFNHFTSIPKEICSLPLHTLLFHCNRITSLVPCRMTPTSSSSDTTTKTSPTKSNRNHHYDDDDDDDHLGPMCSGVENLHLLHKTLKKFTITDNPVQELLGKKCKIVLLFCFPFLEVLDDVRVTKKEKESVEIFGKMNGRMMEGLTRADWERRQAKAAAALVSVGGRK